MGQFTMARKPGSTGIAGQSRDDTRGRFENTEKVALALKPRLRGTVLLSHCKSFPSNLFVLH